MPTFTKNVKVGHPPPCGPSQRAGSATWHIIHDLDMLAVNASMFFAAGGQVAGGGLAVVGGCFNPTPFEPLSCAAGAAGAAVLIPAGAATAAFGANFFYNYTLPALTNWGCSD